MPILGFPYLLLILSALLKIVTSLISFNYLRNKENRHKLLKKLGLQRLIKNNNTKGII
jgi:hypothetical protein